MEATTSFIPVLSIGSGITDLAFYEKAFNAKQLWRLDNPNGSVHVAAFSINGAPFRFHEESKDGRNASPGKTNTTTVTIVLSVDNVHAIVDSAIAAGATLISPVTDHEYGYRQGEIKDPYGHHWQIEKLLSQEALDHFMNKK